MKRDLEALENTSYDVLIVGGGIYGASIFYKLCKAGYKTALIDRGDFASGTSSNSLKILHGGLRYLQNLDIYKMRASIESRREILRYAPQLVEPLRCVIPTYGYGTYSNEVTRSALFLNDLLSSDKNQLVSPANHLGNGQVWKKEHWKMESGELYRKHHRGAMIWDDAILRDTERLVIQLILDGCSHGGSAGNYLELESVEPGELGTHRAHIYNRLDHTSLQIHSRVVINTAGTAILNRIEADNERKLLPRYWAKGINLITHCDYPYEFAIGLNQNSLVQNLKEARKKRFYFFVPWHGKLMIGTEYHLFDINEGSPEISEAEVDAFLESIREVYPELNVSRGCIEYVHKGILPINDNKYLRDTSKLPLLTRDLIIDHQKKGGKKGIFSVCGVKYTTAFYVANKMLKTIQSAHEPSAGASGNQSMDLNRAKPLDLDNLTSEHIEHLITHEMAMSLSDILLRRLNVSARGKIDEKWVEMAANALTKYYSWDTQTRELRIQEFWDECKSHHYKQRVEVPS